jgi:hypothetical protein
MKKKKKNRKNSRYCHFTVAPICYSIAWQDESNHWLCPWQPFGCDIPNISVHSTSHIGLKEWPHYCELLCIASGRCAQRISPLWRISESREYGAARFVLKFNMPQETRRGDILVNLPPVGQLYLRKGKLWLLGLKRACQGDDFQN